MVRKILSITNNSWLWFRSAGLSATLARSHVRISCADLKMRAIERTSIRLPIEVAVFLRKRGI